MLMGLEQGVKALQGSWMTLFQRYRMRTYGQEQVIMGPLRPGLEPGDPELEEVLHEWKGTHYLADGEEGWELVLVRSLGPPEPYRWIRHGLLFMATAFTTLMAGALLRGYDPVNTRFIALGDAWLPVPTTVVWHELALGLPFAVSFLAILLIHEMGHYVAARRHRIRVTLPYFIPFPAYYSVVGTLGAFIRLKGPTVQRKILFDVGAAGPIGSLLASIPVLALGLALSRSAPGHADVLTPYVVEFAGEPIWLGQSALVGFLAALFVPAGAGGGPVLFHPLAFAGWLGLFITVLNLLPFGQLDGGHILYAMFGPAQKKVGMVLLLLLIPLGTLWWGWWFWGVIALVLGRGRLRHPPVLQEQVPLGGRRTLLAWILILIFFLIFIPIPLEL